MIEHAHTQLSERSARVSDFIAGLSIAGLLLPEAVAYSAIAGLTQPIFDHGRLRAQRDEALSREQELLASYRAAIIASLVDVEKSLAAVQHLDAVREFQQGSVAESERAFEGTQLRYQRGSGDFLTLLQSQRTLYAARDQFAQYRLARLQALVALCKALGGGWNAAAAETPRPLAEPGSGVPATPPSPG